MDGPKELGRYRIEKRLAVGGMAEVFLGRMTGVEGFEKRVVIKRMLPAYRGHEDMVTMFLDEARLGARFTHPNLVQIHELIEIGGNYCIVMEYLEGEDLDRIISECRYLGRKIDFDLIALFTAETAEALHYAHELRTDSGQALNIVHRDISPANIFVTCHGDTKVVDFGIAKSEESSKKTRTGVIKGKYPYLSPEQVAAKRLDRRSDVFSLGSVLYEMLTLQQAFRRPTPLDTARAIVAGDCVPVVRYRTDVPGRLSEILDKMHAVDRDRRYGNCREVALDMRQFLAEHRTPAPGDVADFMGSLFTTDNANTRRTYMGSPAADGGSATVEVVNSRRPPVAAHTTAIVEVDSQSRSADWISGPTEIVQVAPTAEESQATTVTHAEVVGADVQTTALDVLGEVREIGPQAAPRFRARFPLVALVSLSLVVVVIALAASWGEPKPDDATPVEPQLSANGAAASIEGQDVPSPVQLISRAQHSAPQTVPVVVAVPSPSPQEEPAATSAPAARKAKGRVSLKSTPRATVLLDGRKMGRTPVELVATVGIHTVLLSVKQEGISKVMKLKFQAGQHLTKLVTFRKGSVVVAAMPWANVYLRGRKLGQTPIVVPVYEGTHEFVLVNPGRRSTRRVIVKVKPGESAKVKEKM